MSKIVMFVNQKGGVGKSTRPKYRSNIGRHRYNTMMHPDLIELRLKIAKGRNVSTPDLIEEILSDALGIDPPSKL